VQKQLWRLDVGRFNVNQRDEMNGEIAEPAAMSSVVASSSAKGPPKQYPESFKSMALPRRGSISMRTRQTDNE
jgi:hypothetical protein